jgi:Tol biopolymer transport system component
MDAKNAKYQPQRSVFFNLLIMVSIIYLYQENSFAQSGSPDNKPDVSVNYLFPMSGGYDLTPDERYVIYSKPVKGVNQLFRRNLINGNNVCLTCRDIPNGPDEKVHKGAPTVHPDGKHVVLQVEMPRHPFPGKTGHIGSGWYNNLWMTTIDGDRWWQLTDYPHERGDINGVLTPKISPNGKRVAFARLYESDPRGQAQYRKKRMVPNTNPWGKWYLSVADIVFDGNKVELRNVQNHKSLGGSFFETQAWSPDNRKIMFATDIGKSHVYQLDLWQLDLRTGKLEQLTDTDHSWEEFADYSPDGHMISFMRSTSSWDATSEKSIPFGKTLSTELFLMRSDGTDKKQITDINHKGIPKISMLKRVRGRKVITRSKWKKDGRGLFFSMVFFSKWNKPRGAGLFELDFGDGFLLGRQDGR